ncbi:MAG: cupin domain-containing protein [Actinobacteria bacterium]|nr:cupin domain-containing protein [Actinomycetota bacterium]
MSDGAPPRRIVCALDDAGAAAIAADGPALPVDHTAGAVWRIWAADGPAQIGAAEPAHGPEFFPPAGGSRVYLSEMPVDPNPIDPATRMHATDTVDFAIVVSGRVRLIQGDGSQVEVVPGAVIVQAGTEHAWENPGPDPARIVFVLLGASA